MAAVSLVVTTLGLWSAGPANAVAGPVTPTGFTVVLDVRANINPLQFSSAGTGVTFSISPAVPAGLTFDATGLLSGRPTAVSAATPYTVTATDATGATTSPATFTMSVRAVVLPPTQPVVATVGQALPLGHVVVADGFFPAPTFTFVNAPAWLGIDANGNLTGTPDAVLAAKPVTVNVTDATGAFATTSFTLSVTASALTPGSQSLTGRVSQPLSPAGVLFPTAGVVYSVTPDITTATGLGFNTVNGAISGTPTKPITTTAFTIQQRNATSNAILGESVASVAIDGYLGAGTPVKASAGVDMTPVVPFGPGAAQLAGLAGAVSFAVSPALPTGMTLDAATGALSGLPTVASSRDYVITATDAQGAKASGTVTITVGGQLLPQSQTIAGAVASSLSSASMAITGMRAPVTYSISPAAPAGLFFDSSTGALSGIPTVALASSQFTITATDSVGAKATASLTLSVTKTDLTVPVIGSVTGGTSVGSLLVYFARPSFAPAGQTYTVKVFDATGATMVTSVTATASPVTITGLVGGETYSVIVVADATLSFSAVESLPKTGTATSTATVEAVSLASAGTVPNVSTLSTSASSGASTSGKKAQLTAAGITIASASAAATATKIFSTKPPTHKKTDSPKIHVPMNTNLSIVLSGVKVKDKLEVWIKVKKFTFVSLGVIKAVNGTLTVPTLSGSKPGRYVIRFSPKGGGAPGYIKVIFDEPKGSSSSPSHGSSSSSSGSSSDGF